MEGCIGAVAEVAVLLFFLTHVCWVVGSSLKKSSVVGYDVFDLVEPV